MLRIGVLVSGGGSNLQAIIDEVEKGKLKGVEIKVVISNKPGVYALQRAEEKDIKTEVVEKNNYKDNEGFNRALLKTINSYQVDLIVLAGFLPIISENIIKEYENKIINIHPSLIPAFSGDGYYGLKVHEAALKRGVKLTGATVHFVDNGTDTGPIIIQRAIEVKKDDDPKTLQKRVMEQVEWKILPEAIGLIAKKRISMDNNRVKII